MFYVYILYSSSANKYYIGSCMDMEERLARHNTGRNTSTKYGIPWTIKKVETFPSRAEATTREAYIKRMKSRIFTEQVIAGNR